MATGKVKWFNSAKGFGFVTADSDGRDVFVHFSVIEAAGYRRLWDEERVEYECEETSKGLRATKVVRVEAPVNSS